MSVLPIVDLLILFSWTTLAAGALLKVGNVIFAKYWTLFGFDPIDLLAISVSMLVFAISLIGRQWLKANENALPAAQRAHSTLDAYEEVTREEARREESRPADPATTPTVQAGWETRPLER